MFRSYWGSELNPPNENIIRNRRNGIISHPYSKNMLVGWTMKGFLILIFPIIFIFKSFKTISTFFIIFKLFFFDMGSVTFQGLLGVIFYSECTKLLITSPIIIFSKMASDTVNYLVCTPLIAWHYADFIYAHNFCLHFYKLWWNDLVLLLMSMAKI